LGKGSCFTLRVPVRLQAGLQQLATEDEFEPVVGRNARSNSDTVLIIDSDLVATDHVRQILSQEGYQPITARSAEEGLALANATRPGVILLGALNPESDGWLVMQGVKASEPLRSCPLILLTAQQDSAKGRAFGASAHLIKPIGRDELLRALGNVRTEVEDEQLGVSLLERAVS